VANKDRRPEEPTSPLVAREQRIRARLGVPVAAGGAVYLLGAIIIYQSLLHLPVVGVLQALTPALEGEAQAPRSPEALEVRYLAGHAFGLIAGAVLEALGLLALFAGLYFLLEATRARSDQASEGTRITLLIGGILTPLILIVQQIVRDVKAHQFIHGHNFSQAAVEAAVSKGAANLLAGYLGLLLPVVLVVGMVLTLVRAARVGLVPRWLRTFGVVCAFLLLPVFASAFLLQILVAGFMVALGFLFLERLPEGDPPAWREGRAIPWPSPAAAKAEQAKAKG
jgi:hypothetical protein